MRWDQLDLALRTRLLQWHAPIWEPLIRRGLEGSGDLQGKRILEVGCGDGGLACLLAECGARVYATDLSHMRLKAARKLAAQTGMLRRVNFFRADAYHLPLAPNSVDLIITRSVIVLLDRKQILPSFCRLLVSGRGVAVFIENMEHHPALQLWRLITRTKHGSQGYLSQAEVHRFGAHFEQVEANYTGLLLPAVGPLGRLQSVLAPAVARVDAALLSRVPQLSRYAWLVTLRCTGPKSGNAPKAG